MKGVRSFSDVLAVINFRLWRWYFTKYKLPRLLGKSYDQLRAEYDEYKQMVWSNNHAAMSFEDWCGTK